MIIRLKKFKRRCKVHIHIKMVIKGNIPDIRKAIEVRRNLEDLDEWKESAERIRRQFKYCPICEKETLRVDGKCTLCAKVEYDLNQMRN